ncbi:MAG: selenocysteine-specific translation elongation factor [Planctomycetota bacterium]
MSKDFILGTAGHIDHGKTSLVRALTGTDTDRLPEEKKRGITIELGYAYLEVGGYRLGVVDVPGHEKFIRQMLSGATGMDLAMLVVAADDSIKQQTREHLDILRMLDLAAGIVVITKADLVDPQWLELVREEVRELVAGTVFAEGEVIATSVKTLQGLDELRAALERAAARAEARQEQRRQSAPFRLPIDRAFVVEGFGTVVTGSVVSGRAQVGDALILQPSGVEVRVRGLQNHEQQAEFVSQGQRAAVNLAGVHHEELQRGQELAAPGYLRAATVMTVELLLLPDLKREFNDRTRIRFHLGTQENLGIVRLLEQATMGPGERCLAQVYLDAPSVATWSQPFVIRQESPLITLGGGRILDPHAELLRRPMTEELSFVRQLASANELERVEAAIYLDAGCGWTAAELPATVGVYNGPAAVAELVRTGSVVEVPVSAQRKVWLHRRRLEQLAEQIRTNLQKMHAAAPLKLAHPLGDLLSKLKYLDEPEVVQAALGLLTRSNQVSVVGGQIALEGHGPKMSRAERLLLPQLVEALKAAGLAVPLVKELQNAQPKNRETVPQLLRLAEGAGDLVGINPELFLHRETMEAIKAKLEPEFHRRGSLTVSEIRELLETSRKYAVPLCEYFDSSGYTVREGDTRRLKAAATNS